MKDKRYGRNKWFAGSIAVVVIWMTLLLHSGNPDDQWGAFALVILLIGIVLYWPIDYMIHKRTVRQFSNKQATIDPNFRRNRMIIMLILVVVAVAYTVGGLLSN